MGFGFVEYKKPEGAQKALRQLQVSLSLPAWNSVQGFG